MKRFQFSLQRVLEWRSLQMRSSEEQLARLQENHAGLVHRETALAAAELKSETALLTSPVIRGSELQSLAAFRLGMKSERATLQAARLKCEAEIAQQRTRVVKARRDFRVLEKLKERRFHTWTYEADREMENMAAEAYLSRWSRPETEESR